MQENIIEIVGLSKSFQNHGVLRDLSLNIKHGEFLTLLGASGCGKTTLLRMLSGFETPDVGRILINGKDVSRIPPNKRHVNTVFQNYALFPHMTIYDNVAFGLRCQKVAKNLIEKQVLEALDMVKLAHLADRKPKQLSGGQQQRVAIARAVVNKPLVLLLDEPLSSLDYRLRKIMQIELKELQRKLGITFIFVTHDQEEALSMSDRVAMMHEGAIEQVGAPREVYEEPANLQVAKFIGEANLFETKILALRGDQIQVEIEGQTMLLNNPRHLKLEDHIVTLVRPEDLKVWAENEVTDTKDMVAATVIQVIYKGSTVDLMLRLDSGKTVLATEFFDEDDEQLDFHVHEKVWAQWRPGWEVLLKDE